MTEAQNSLLKLIAKSLFGIETSIGLSESIKLEAQRQAVSGIVDKKAYASFVNNVNISRAHAGLFTVLEHIPYTTIKGYASAFYYPEPLRRTMGDVDFLVDIEKSQLAEQQLLQHGFTKSDETEIHKSFIKNGICFEMHNKISGMPEENIIAQDLLKATISTSRVISTNDGPIIIPDDYHNGLICLLHIIKHMKSTGIGLRHFCDWACFVNKTDNFESLLRDTLERAGLWHCACVFSLTAVRYIGLPYQAWMGGANDSVLDSLMSEIMAGGNFGYYHDCQESNWFVDKQSGVSKMSGVIFTLNQSIKAHCPRIANKRILYPLGWIYVIFKYSHRVFIGKRKRIDFLAAFRQANKKNRLIKELALFEMNKRR